MDINQRDLK